VAASKEDALKLLSSSTAVSFLSEELKEALSELMTFHSVDDGHIFVMERASMDVFLMIQEGVLGRYKIGLDEAIDSKATLHATIVSKETFSILVDTVEGYGRTTGFFHVLSDKDDHNRAYATIMAKGPAKVWSIKGADFRALIQSNGAFGLELLAVTAMRVRKESKISRALLKTANAMSSTSSKEGGKLLKVMCYDSTSWVSDGFKSALQEFNKMLANGDENLEIGISFTEERLSAQTAAFAAGHDAVCTFVNDTASADIIQTLSLLGIKMIAQRAAGFDRIDTHAANAFGMTVARVPAYSPYAVAEFAISLLMAVNRKITKANNRVKMSNFTLDAGLMGMDIHGKTIGVMGTGKIGAILCNIVLGFGAKLLCFDVFENDSVKAAGGTYVTKDELYAQSDVVFLMMPLLPATKHTINAETVSKLKKRSHLDQHQSRRLSRHQSFATGPPRWDHFGSWDGRLRERTRVFLSRLVGAQYSGSRSGSFIGKQQRRLDGPSSLFH